MFCREQAARFESEKAAFTSAGARLVAIGNGTRDMARDFVDKFNITFEVVTDPDRETYRLAGMEHGIKIGLASLKAGVRAFKRGHMQGRIKGDPLQQGGIVVVSTDGTILFNHADSSPGDHIDPEDVLRLLPSAG